MTKQTREDYDAFIRVGLVFLVILGMLVLFIYFDVQEERLTHEENCFNGCYLGIVDSPNSRCDVPTYEEYQDEMMLCKHKCRTESAGELRG